PKECPYRGKKFQVTAPHPLSRDDQLARDAGNVRYVVKHQHIAVGIDAITAKSQRHAAVFAIVNPNFIALKQQALVLTGTIFAPKTFFSADDEMSIVVIAFCPRERRRPVELDSFPAKGDLARFEHDPKNHVAERRG